MDNLLKQKKMKYLLLLLLFAVPVFAQAPQFRQEATRYYLNSAAQWTTTSADLTDTLSLPLTTTVKTDSFITRRGNFGVDFRVVNANKDSANFYVVFYRSQSGMHFFTKPDSLMDSVKADTGWKSIDFKLYDGYGYLGKIGFIPMSNNINTKITNTCLGTQ